MSVLPPQGQQPLLQPQPQGQQQQQQQQQEEKHDVFVGNVTFNTTEEQLYALFGFVGPVKNIRILVDKETGRPKGFAFVEYADANSALAAIRRLDGSEMNGRRLRVSFSNNSNLRDLARQIGQDVTESESTLRQETQAVLSLQLYEAWEILMLAKRMADEGSGDRARQLFESFPQLMPALLQIQRRLGILNYNNSNNNNGVGVGGAGNGFNNGQFRGNNNNNGFSSNFNRPLPGIMEEGLPFQQQQMMMMDSFQNQQLPPQQQFYQQDEMYPPQEYYDQQQQQQLQGNFGFNSMDNNNNNMMMSGNDGRRNSNWDIPPQQQHFQQQQQQQQYFYDDMNRGQFFDPMVDINRLPLQQQQQQQPYQQHPGPFN